MNHAVQMRLPGEVIELSDLHHPHIFTPSPTNAVGLCRCGQPDPHPIHLKNRVCPICRCTKQARLVGCRCVVPTCYCPDPTLPAAPKAVA